MPVLRITYTRPDDSLPPVVGLAKALTDAVVSRHDLSRWSNELRTAFRVRLHEVPKDRFLAGGAVSGKGLYDVEYIVPAETLTEGVRDAIAEGVARAVLEWEGAPWDEVDAMRVMLIITDVRHDRWFWGGKAVTPRSIIDYLARLRRTGRRSKERRLEEVST